MRQCRLDQMPFANHIAVLWQARAAAGDAIRVEYEMLGEVQQRIAIAKDRLKKWYADEAKQLEIRRDLDSNREDTIRNTIIRAYQKANPAPVQRGG